MRILHVKVFIAKPPNNLSLPESVLLMMYIFQQSQGACLATKVQHGFGSFGGFLSGMDKNHNLLAPLEGRDHLIEGLLVHHIVLLNAVLIRHNLTDNSIKKFEEKKR